MILFPSDYFNFRELDPEFQTEYEAVAKLPDIKILLFNYDGFVAGEKIKIYPKEYYSGVCIYRGWMLTPAQYLSLYEFLNNKGITLINTPDEYNYCHLFPSVRDVLGRDTPQSLCYEHGAPIDWNKVKRYCI